MSHALKTAVIFSLAFLIIAAPFVVLAQGIGPIVPQNCGKAGQPSCNFSHLIQLANSIINFLIRISSFLAAIAFTYVGWLYVTSGGDSGKKSEAKGILMKVVFGFVLVLGAWLIVKLILTSLGYGGGPGFIGNFVS